MNLCRPLQKLVSERRVVVAPDPEPVIQLPLTAKHPLVMFIPFAKVEEDEPVISRFLADKPPANVDVAVVDVA